MHLGFYSYHAYSVLTRPVEGQVGGMELQLLELGRGLVRRGHRITFFVGDEGQSDVEHVEGMTFRKVFSAGSSSIMGRLRRLWSVLGTDTPDAFLERGASSIAGVLCFMAHRLGKPYIFAAASDFNCMRSAQDPWMPTWRDRLSLRSAVRRADEVVVQSGTQSALLLDSYGRKGRVIRNIPLFASESGGPSRGRHAVWIANLHAYKRPEIVLELAAALPEVPFIIVGGTRDAEYARSFREKASQFPNIEFRGFVPPREIAGVLRESRVLLNTTIPHSEGFPNSFIQAWMYGVPVVSLETDPDDLLASHGAGFRSGTAPAMITDLRRLMFDDVLHAQMAEKAKRLFSSVFDPGAVLTAYETLFEEVRGERGRRPSSEREEA